MREVILVLFLGFTTNLVLTQNCTTTVDLGEDIVACGPGTIVALNGSITGSVYEFRWSPTAPISDLQSTNPSVQVDSTTTFSFTAFSISDIDLIVNGNFDDGNTGFTSDYILKTGSGNLNDGFYAVASSPEDVHSQFRDYDDHTGNNGNMLYVNANSSAPNVWCQDIIVTPGTAYLFSAWVASAVRQNPGELQFSINGQLLGDNFKASGAAEWEQFSAFWEADQTSTAQICVVNVNQDPAGNDFTLDDIEFRELCRATDEVTVEVIDLFADFIFPTEICQNEPIVALNSFLDFNASPGGIWTIDETPVTVLDASSLSPGDHRVKYTVSQNICAAELEATFTVFEAVSTGTPIQDVFNFCGNLDTLFALNDFLEGEDTGGLWSIQDAPMGSNQGALIDGTTLALNNPMVGLYQIRYVIPNEQRCNPTFTDFVIQVEDIPAAYAGEDVELFCESAQLILGDDNTTPNPDLSYQWFDENDVLLGNENTLITNAPGVYIFEITNTLTTCSNQDTVNIIIQNNDTAIEASFSFNSLDCGSGRFGTINVIGTKGGDEPYSYAIDGGPFQTESVFDNINSGPHTITIQDANGCEETFSVQFEAFEPLTASIISTPNLTIQAGDTIGLRLLLNTELENIDSIIWDPVIPGCNGCINPMVAPIMTTNYQAIVLDNNGCSVTASKLLVVDEASIAYVPNAFSPNEDQQNDIFFVNASNIVSQITQLLIVDRWGNVIFSEENIPPNNPNFGWDGSFDGQAVAAGVYAYSITIELNDGRFLTQNGELNVIR